jgi:hypothetical protein
MSPITGTATACRGAITVEVLPGGALTELTLTSAALALSTRELAATIVRTVASATATANLRTRHTLNVTLPGLGLDTDPALIEQAELTTPGTWSL